MNAKTALSLLAASVLSAGVAGAEVAPGSRCIEMVPTLPGAGFGAIDAGGYSLSTGEHAVASASLVAFLEAADGTAHAAFGVAPRDILILRTGSGRHVVRIMTPRPGSATSGPAAAGAKEAAAQH